MFRTTSDEAEPNSTLTAEKSVAASSRIVRLQGGGLRFLDAHEIRNLTIMWSPGHFRTTTLSTGG